MNWVCNGQTLTFDGRLHVMGVINLSPESHVTQSVVDSPKAALDRARHYRDLGATIIDIGGQSSYYEFPEIAAAEEIDRIVPAIELLVADEFVVSVDTWKPAVARAALGCGAAILNDTGGAQDPEMLAVLRDHPAPVVLVYVEGRNPHDVGVMESRSEKWQQMSERFRDRARALTEVGVKDLLVDPGLSINYRGDYEEYSRLQVAVIRDTPRLRELGHPVLVPVPFKLDYPHWRPAYMTMAIEYGADVVRVHDVESACAIGKLWGRL